MAAKRGISGAAMTSALHGRRPVVGVMGAGETATDADCGLAERIGELVATRGWVLLTGGRDRGVMAAASRGAKRVAGSLTIGILPSESGPAAADVDVAIYTGMGNARNAINVLSSDVVVACGTGGPGTAAETALAIKSGKPVVLLAAPEATRRFVATLGGRTLEAETAEDAVARIAALLGDLPGERV
jgi:uncharacterized protein (TIGR00725 family)